MVRHRTTNLQTFTFANFHLPQLRGFVIYFFPFSRRGCVAGNLAGTGGNPAQANQVFCADTQTTFRIYAIALMRSLVISIAMIIAGEPLALPPEVRVLPGSLSVFLR